MSAHRFTRLLAFAVVAAGTTAPVTAATLVGDSVNALAGDGFFRVIDTSAVVVDPGIEFFSTQNIPSFRLDVGPDTLTLIHAPSQATNTSIMPSGIWTISDLDWTGEPDRVIVGVEFLSSVGSGMGSPAISFTADSVTFSGTYSIGQAGAIPNSATYRLITAVPEPASLSLLAGAGVLVLARRTRIDRNSKNSPITFASVPSCPLSPSCGRTR